MSKRKKILIFSTAYFPFVGGAEVAVKEITNRLGDDFSFDLITARMKRNLPKFEKIDKINVYRVGIGHVFFDKLFLAFLGWIKAKKLNKQNNYLFSWAIMASFGGLSALFFKKRSKVPLFLSLQEGDDLEYIKKKSFCVRKSFLEIFIKADFIQTISSFLKNWAIENGARSENRIIPNGVDFLKFKRDDNFNREEFRKKLGFKNDDKLIISTSRLVKKNGTKDLLKSLSYLEDKFKFLILGEGEEKDDLIKISKELNLENKVHFLGTINHQELPKYLWASDIFCRPSLSEGLGNSFLEAMASGLPVVATEVGGIPDFLCHQENALFCEVENPKSIARQIKKIFSNEDLKNKIIKNGIKTVSEKYTWEIVAKQMSEAFSALEKKIKERDLNILITTGIFPPDIGGPATYSFNLEKEFLKQGHNVNVLKYKIEKKLPSIIRHFVFFIRTCFNIKKIDFILALDTFSVGLPSLLAAKVFNKKFIIRTGGDFLWESYIERTGEKIVLSDFYLNKNVKLSFKEKIIFKLTKFLFSNSSAIIFSTEYQKNIFKKPYNLIEEKCFIVENCYDPIIKRDDGWAEKEKIFIWAGRDINIKNVEILKKGFNLAKKEKARIELKLFYNLKHDDLMKEISNSYAVILPSLSEISPNFILEAISLRAPFILTQENGLTNRIAELGLFFDPLNPEELKEKILYLAEDENYIKIKERFDNFNFINNYSTIANKIINVYYTI